MEHNLYFNLRKQRATNDISLLFPDWRRGEERVAVFGPHDDDPLIGVGHLMAAAMENGGEVFILLFCQGDCGYSTPAEKDGIVEVRRRETVDAYSAFGIPAGHIYRLEYPDFSAMNFKGNHLPGGDRGSFEKIIRYLRENRITRVLIPNGYQEHADHTAVYEMAAFDIVQAGDPIAGDWGEAACIKSVLQYAVWADFSPEDMLIRRDTLRANRALLSPEPVEQRIIAALERYRSQEQIIAGLIEQRKERRVSGRYLELYIAMELRPKLAFGPYIERVGAILSYADADGGARPV